MKIEIIDSEDSKIPSKYRGMIIDELNRILPKIRGNESFDLIKIHNLNIRYHKSSAWNDFCDINNAKVITLMVKYDRHDSCKGGYSHRSSGHAGIQIFIPKSVKKHRNNLLSEILGFDK